MTEFTFTSKDPEGLLCVLGEASIEFANDNAPQSMALIDELRNQLRAQVKPAIEEPKEFGSIVRAPWNGRDRMWLRVQKGYWEDETGIGAGWAELQHPEVLRIGAGVEYHHSLQQLRDILFRSPSGEMTNREGAEAYKALRAGLGRLLAGCKP